MATHMDVTPVHVADMANAWHVQTELEMVGWDIQRAMEMEIQTRRMA
jgi:hypothetical protein